MELKLTTYLIVCPLVFLAGFIDSIAGGGGLISLPAYLLAGLPAHLASGTNKMSAVFGTALATSKYAREGASAGGLRCLRWRGRCPARGWGRSCSCSSPSGRCRPSCWPPSPLWR